MERDQPNPLENTSDCLEHSAKFKFMCTECVEMACAECLLTTHKDHEYSKLEDARQGLEAEFKELAELSVEVEEIYSEHLKKLSKVEGEMAKYTRCMTDIVDKMFDAIKASVETQRNEALQTMSERLKEIQSEKEFMEVNLPKINDFNQLADCIHEYESSTAMTKAIQGIKVMERLMDISKGEVLLFQKMMPFWSLGSENLPIHFQVPLDKFFKLGEAWPPLQFDPDPDKVMEVFVFDGCVNSAVFTVSLKSEGPHGLQLMFPTSCSLDVEVCKSNAHGTKFPIKVRSEKQGVWKVVVDLNEEKEKEKEKDKIIIRCTLFDVTEEITYTIKYRLLTSLS